MQIQMQMRMRVASASASASGEPRGCEWREPSARRGRYVPCGAVQLLQRALWASGRLWNSAQRFATPPRLVDNSGLRKDKTHTRAQKVTGRGRKVTVESSSVEPVEN